MKIRFLIGWCIVTVLSTHTVRAESLWIDSKDTPGPVNLQLPSFAPVVEKLGEAVVNISSEGEEKPERSYKSHDRFGRPQGPAPFDFFLNPPEGPKRMFVSLGSGFVIHPTGYIVTNFHVVEKASKIRVSFRDEKKNYEAKLVGGDSKTDIALLKIEVDHPLTAVSLGDSDTVLPGDWVIAIGNPFRLGHTATVGIVSAKSRRNLPGGGVGPYDDFIQTDASINPGNSGGPLFNTRGEVIGVNTAIFSPGRMGNSGFNIGIGFATPVNIVKSIISQLKEHGKVTRGWLGVLIQRVTDDVAQALKLPESSGALVADIMPDSPGAKAGIKRGDVIVTFDGHPVENSEDLPLMVANTEIGKKVKIDVIRKGGKETLTTTIAELKEEVEVQEQSEESEEEKLGLTIQEITPDLAKSLGADGIRGVVVTDVASGGVAELSGLQRGDIILEVDGVEVNNAVKFRAETKDIKAGKPVLLLVRRQDNTIFLTLKVE